MRTSRNSRIVGLAFVVAAALLPVATRAGPPTIADCDARVLAAPRDPRAYYCYVIAAEASGRFDDSIRRLEALLALDPELHRAHLDIAVLEHDLGRPSAIETYRQAIDGMQGAGDAWGLVYGHSGLGALLDSYGRHDEAGPHFDHALAIARASDEPVMLAHAQTRAAAYADNRMDYAEALRLYRQAESIVFPDGPPYLKSWVLSGLGRVHWAVGERYRALAVYEREADHLRSIGNRFGEASPRYNIALITSQLSDHGQADPALVRPLADRALQVAIESGNRNMEGVTRQLLSTLLTGAACVEESKRALRALEGVGTVEQLLGAQRNLAQAMFLLGPEYRDEARSILTGAIEEARDSGDHFSETRGLVMRAAFRRLDDAPREQVVEAFHAAIEAVEHVRELQSDHAIRAKNFGEWTFVYARFADYLLRGLPAASMPEQDLELAFQTLERMRARVLLELLNDAGVTENSDPKRGWRPRPPDLRSVRDLLGPRQALLVYHLNRDPLDDGRDHPTEHAGSWILRITRDGVRVFSIPESLRMQQSIAVYRGLFAARDGSEAVPAMRLYDDLMADAIDTLEAEVDRLIIVPDGVLHELPFGTLRPSVRSPPLASRFEIAYSPSVTLWARSLELRTDTGAPNVLAIADPDLGLDADSVTRAAGPGFSSPVRTRLPHATDEARALLQRLGGRGIVLGGADATEEAIKQIDLSGYDVLHLAAHAVVDRTRPERSAVVLAPGTGSEDGLLHMREIAELDLDGQLVILSACRSASGELVDGEGMVGLSRAFFQAGARTIVGSLWPLRDDETAAFIEDFSRELGSGLSVAAALAETRRRWIAADAPPAAWAGLVVLGDGDLVLTDGRGRLPAWLPVLIPILALLALGLWLIRLRESGSSHR